MNNLDHLRDELLAINTISAAYYDQFEVKRGLRNRDGSGVLAGLTRVSSVLGAKSLDYKRIPIEGELSFRGYSVSDLIAETDAIAPYRFEKTTFLLLFGRIPTDSEWQHYRTWLSAQKTLPTAIHTHIIQGIPNHHLMNKAQLGVSALYNFDKDPESADPFENAIKALKLASQLPLIVAYAYQQANGKSGPIDLPPSASIAETFLRIIRNGEDPDPLHIAVLDVCLLLHAEHGGGNNSSFTTRVVSSSGSDIYSTISAAIASLKGPLHGSANKKVMEMMADAKTDISDWTSDEQITQYLTKIINKKAHDRSGKIYGLGHAVYTKSDPRAVILKTFANQLAVKTDRMDELGLYERIAAIGPALFRSIKGSQKEISPNVDFFSGFVYECMGLPTDVYTPLFAIARVVGWASHRIEEICCGKRIIRPGYKYVNPDTDPS